MKINQMKFDINETVDKIKYYIAFSHLNASPIFKAKLFEYFEYDVKRAWLIDENDLKILSQETDVSIPRNILQKITEIDIEKCYQEFINQKNVKILTYDDEKYPPLLREIPDFPLMLYYKGDIDGLDFSCNLAVVGSRKATTGAKIALNKIISEFKGTNITIVSGLAYGIDAQAHQSAIENDLKTIGVIGCGIDIIYPKSNKYIYDEIEQKSGVIFSEFPLKTPPLAQNFPQRNRIVVGMSKGTLVAEAQKKSGAMISANLALDYNRELMCIPGNITNPNTEGIYHLIKNGAGIVISAQDILSQMNWEMIPKMREDIEFEFSELQKKVLDIISLEAKSFDEIINEVRVDTASLMVALTELEIKGVAIQSNNKYFKV